MTQDETKGTYRLYVWCRNCGMRDHVTVAKGTPIHKQPCPKCRCCDLERVP